MTRGIKVFIFGVDLVANVKNQNLVEKNSSQSVLFMKICKFLPGLVGFGNLRFAEIKSHPSAYQTSELSKDYSVHVKYGVTVAPSATIFSHFTHYFSSHFTHYFSSHFMPATIFHANSRPPLFFI